MTDEEQTSGNNDIAVMTTEDPKNESETIRKGIDGTSTKNAFLSGNWKDDCEHDDSIIPVLTKEGLILREAEGEQQAEEDGQIRNRGQGQLISPVQQETVAQPLVQVESASQHGKQESFAEQIGFVKNEVSLASPYPETILHPNTLVQPGAVARVDPVALVHEALVHEGFVHQPAIQQEPVVHHEVAEHSESSMIHSRAVVQKTVVAQVSSANHPEACPITGALTQPEQPDAATHAAQAGRGAQAAIVPPSGNATVVVHPGAATDLAHSDRVVHLEAATEHGTSVEGGAHLGLVGAHQSMMDQTAVVTHPETVANPPAACQPDTANVTGFVAQLAPDPGAVIQHIVECNGGTAIPHESEVQHLNVMQHATPAQSSVQHAAAAQQESVQLEGASRPGPVDHQPTGHPGSGFHDSVEQTSIVNQSGAFVQHEVVPHPCQVDLPGSDGLASIALHRSLAPPGNIIQQEAVVQHEDLPHPHHMDPSGATIHHGSMAQPMILHQLQGDGVPIVKQEPGVEDETAAEASTLIAEAAAAAAAAVAAAVSTVEIDATVAALAVKAEGEDMNAKRNEQRRKRYREKSFEDGPKRKNHQSHEDQLAARRVKDRERYANMTPDMRQEYNKKRRDQYHRQGETSRRKRRERERNRYHSVSAEAAKARNARRAKLERERYQRMTASELEAKNRKRRERARQKKESEKQMALAKARLPVVTMATAATAPPMTPMAPTTTAPTPTVSVALPQVRAQTVPFPAVQVPAAQLPAVQDPVAQSPAVQVPAAQLPAVQVPAAQLPVVQVPAAQLPAVQVPAAQLPEVEAPAFSPFTALMPPASMAATTHVIETNVDIAVETEISQQTCTGNNNEHQNGGVVVV